MARRVPSPHLRLLAGALLGLGACGGGEPERAPNVVLLVLDTVRADHLGCYGYEAAVTPFLDALAAAADRYTQVESTAPWTLPSHASMFTGRFPFEHGAHAGRNADGAVYDARPLAESQATLAEVLGQCGYQRAAFVANTAYLNPVFGLNRGFETYDVERGPATQVNGRFFSWLSAREQASPDGQPPPFFAFLNYMDAHRPYNCEPLPPPRGDLVGVPDATPSGELLDLLYEQVLARGEAPDPQLVARITGQYDHGIAWLDLAVEAVANQLRARGLWESTLLIVTSDHGEFLGEHGLVEHSKDVYQEVLHVPLILKRPGQTQARLIRERTSLAALPRLVLEQLPSELAARHAAQFPEHRAGSPVMAELHYTRGKDLRQPWGARFMRVRHVLYAERFKLILSSDGRHELYDLEADALEAENLYTARPQLAATLEDRLRGLLAAGTPGGAGAGSSQAAELDEAQLEELRRLGYL